MDSGFARLSADAPTTGGEVSGTTELIFTLGGGALQSYGDRVTATTMGTFSYAGEPTFTPNVEAAYHGDPRTWTGRYGDLQNVVYTAAGALELRLMADLGYQVVLESFEMAAYNSSFASDPTIASVAVPDGSQSALYSQQDVSISEQAHTRFEFPAGLAADQLSVQFDAMGVSSDDIGIDNIRFGQVAE